MKKLALALFIVLAATGLWWWESPRMATENLLDAARDHDLAELEELIDAEKFGASLRAQRADASASPPLKSRAIPPAAMSRPGDRLLSGLARDAELIALRQAARTDWDIERLGFNAFRVVRRTGEGEPLPTLYFERGGLSWRLVGADLTPVEDNP